MTSKNEGPSSESKFSLRSEPTTARAMRAIKSEIKGISDPDARRIARAVMSAIAGIYSNRLLRGDYSACPIKFEGPFWGCVCIPLNNGRHALVDAEDFDIAAKQRYSICFNKTGHTYARHNPKDGPGVSMHREILQPDEEKFVDHINGNGLDNRRANLRIVDNQQNQWNRRKGVKKTSSQYKGVVASYDKWQASIKIGGKRKYLGTFKSEVEAAFAYDCAATENFGPYAHTNLPHFTTNHATTGEK